MVFHWSLSDSKSPQVFGTLLSIMAVLNAVVWMVSTHPPTSKSSTLFNNPLVTVLKASIIIGIIFTFIFHSFFNSQARSRYLYFFSHSFSFILWSADTAKSIILQILFFIVDYYKVFGPRLGNPSVCQSPIGFFVSFSRTDAGLCMYHLFAWSNLNFLYISQWITLPTQSCLVLYVFCANLLHSLIWLIVSSLSPHNLHLLFCCLLPILALIWLVLIIIIIIIIPSILFSCFRYYKNARKYYIKIQAIFKHFKLGSKPLKLLQNSVSKCKWNNI